MQDLDRKHYRDRQGRKHPQSTIDRVPIDEGRPRALLFLPARVTQSAFGGGRRRDVRGSGAGSARDRDAPARPLALLEPVRDGSDEFSGRGGVGGQQRAGPELIEGDGGACTGIGAAAETGTAQRLARAIPSPRRSPSRAWQPSA